MSERNDNPMSDVPSSSVSTTKPKPKSAKDHQIRTQTLKTPPFSYAVLSLITSSPALPSSSDLDNLTVRSYITSALTRFLGQSGSAISVDILKVEGREVWVRVPREDMSPFLAAVGGWVGEQEGRNVGWRVLGSGNWLGALVGERGEEKIWSG